MTESTHVDNEEFYDREIAPALLALCKKCEERGMGFIASVAYSSDGDTGRTCVLPLGSPPVLMWMNVLAQCGEGQTVNIDRFLFALIRHARENGHTSAVLASLGVSTKRE